MSRITRLAALALACAGPVALAAPAPQFRLTLLPDLPGGSASAQGMAINAQGVVAGQSVSALGHVAATWTPQGLASELPEPPGGLVSGMGYGINDAGVVVGTGHDAGGLRGVIWNGAQMTVLADLPGGNNASGALAINNHGVVVGYSYSSQSGTNPTAVRWHNGVALEIGDLPGGSFGSVAQAINDAGTIVGYGTGANGRQAMRWTEQGGMVALGGLRGQTYSTAYGINEAGTAVGSVGNWAVRWDGTQAVQLADLAGGSDLAHARDINNHGWIVGSGNGSFGPRAVLWLDGAPLDLNTLMLDRPAAFFASQAMAVNDAGLITGWGQIGSERVGFLLSPVPEPGSALLWAAGLGVMALRWRRVAGSQRH